jgi:hypothetical protein
MARMTTVGADPPEVEPLPDDVLSICTALLAPGGWLPVDGQPSLLLRSNTALMTALRCTLTADSVTVASVSMMFEEDRPLQLTMQPRGRDAFAAVCDLVNRHAGALDRLDHQACVADLLRYVDWVGVENESSGLIPTIARRGDGGVRYDPAPRPAWPPPERSRAALNQRRRDGDIGLLPWAPPQYKELPRLLAKDRRRNLNARLAYYEGSGGLRPSDGFVRSIAEGRHAVWFPPDDSKGAFAYSIGLAYLHDLPEILLLSPMPAAIGATSRALALTVNAIATAMIGGVRLAPGDRYAAVADVVARTVHKACTLDHARLAESRFVIPSPRIEDRTLASGAWFYANFMDAPSFPALACLLHPPRVPDGYGVPPPPPPPRKSRAAVARARPAAKAIGGKRGAGRTTAKRPAPKRAAAKRAAAKRVAAKRVAAPTPKRPAPKRPSAKKAVKNSGKARPRRKR